MFNVYHTVCMKVEMNGKGVGLDVIPSTVLRLMPNCIMGNILTLIQRVLVDEYPTSWEKVVILNPKLRGVAVGPIISRLYNCIIDHKFRSWFVPNREQGGFR